MNIFWYPRLSYIQLFCYKNETKYFLPFFQMLHIDLWSYMLKIFNLRLVKFCWRCQGTERKFIDFSNVCRWVGWLFEWLGRRKYYKGTMTNSVPKLKNKVDRQGSPNVGVERYHHRSSAIKSSTFFYNGGRSHGKSSTGRLSCSPHNSSKGSRNSPLRCDSPLRYSRGSPTNSFYAGAKFSEPPSPASLPKPPSHWTTRLMSSCQQADRSCDISNHLKMILNVQAWYLKTNKPTQTVTSS